MKRGNNMKFKHRNVFMYSFALFFMTLGLINNNPTKTHSLKAAAPNMQTNHQLIWVLQTKSLVCKKKSQKN